MKQLYEFKEKHPVVVDQPHSGYESGATTRHDQRVEKKKFMKTKKVAVVKKDRVALMKASICPIPTTIS